VRLFVNILALSVPSRPSRACELKFLMEKGSYEINNVI